MGFDPRYLDQERRLLALAGLLGLAAGLLAFFVGEALDEDDQADPASVWRFIRAEAAARELDPGFVYALAWAESSLRPDAESSVARGMMQLTKGAWREVSEQPYRRAWNWQTNVRVSIAYLAFLRGKLQEHDAFSYPLLAASYRYGFYHVKGRDFRMERLKTPENKIYQRLFQGFVRPVIPPEESGGGGPKA